MKNIHYLKTDNGNCYFYNMNKERLFLIHPIFYALLSNTLKNADTIDSDDVLYYKKKELYLKKHCVLETKVSQPKFLRLTPDLVVNNLINTNQITFEVTDKCNLACIYCGYRDLYTNYDQRKGTNFDINKAIKFLEYCTQLWRSNKNLSSHKIVDIAFYGGEPLLNMPFIKKIIEYVKNIKDCNRIFTFSMTTNGILLHKYIDYLVEHNIRLLISLDGDYKANMNRLDKHHHSTFAQVVRNAEYIQSKYPVYFTQKVNFNAVLHDKNPLEELLVFFKTKFNKTPFVGMLNTSGRNEQKRDIFKKMNRDLSAEINTSKHKNQIIKRLSVNAPGYINFIHFVYQCMGSVYGNYNDLMDNKHILLYTQSGTCIPFSKKIFLTVNSKILPCERIGQDFILCNIKDDVEINFKEIANRYNVMFDLIEEKCKKCYQFKNCRCCLLATNGKCTQFTDIKSFQRVCKQQIKFFEDHSKDYKKIINNIIIR